MAKKENKIKLELFATIEQKEAKSNVFKKKQNFNNCFGFDSEIKKKRINSNYFVSCILGVRYRLSIKNGVIQICNIDKRCYSTKKEKKQIEKLKCGS